MYSYGVWRTRNQVAAAEIVRRSRNEQRGDDKSGHVTSDSPQTHLRLERTWSAPGARRERCSAGHSDSPTRNSAGLVLTYGIYRLK